MQAWMRIHQQRTIRRADGVVIEKPAAWISPDIIDRVDLRRAPSAAMSTSSQVIQRLLDTVPLCKFKIGLTGEPDHRWYSGERAPYFRHYDQMYLLHACLTLEGAQFLECHLINKFWGLPYCVNRDNNDFGGTGRAVDDHGLFYVYVVVCDAGKPPEDVNKVFHRRGLCDQIAFNGTDRSDQ